MSPNKELIKLTFHAFFLFSAVVSVVMMLFIIIILRDLSISVLHIRTKTEELTIFLGLNAGSVSSISTKVLYQPLGIHYQVISSNFLDLFQVGMYDGRPEIVTHNRRKPSRGKPRTGERFV